MAKHTTERHASKTVDPDEWVTKREGRNMIRMRLAALEDLANRGLVGTLTLPGSRRTRYRRRDIEAVIAASVRPAKAGPAVTVVAARSGRSA